MSETTVPIEKYREVLAKLEAKDAECKRLTEQVKDDQYMLEKFHTDAAEASKAQRDEAITSLITLSKGKYTKDTFKDETDQEVFARLATAHDIAPKSFINVQRERDEEMRKPKALGSNGTGSFNQDTGKWEGGLQA